MKNLTKKLTIMLLAMLMIFSVAIGLVLFKENQTKDTQKLTITVQ